jgi:formamidopyrimidine-DNA glycosylase
MPEIIEVLKFADILRTNILGHKITHINILKGRYAKKPFEGYNDLIKELPLTIDAINTKGKFTYFTLSNSSKTHPKTFYLFNTLGLSGGWTIKGSKKSDFAKCDLCHYMTMTNVMTNDMTNSDTQSVFTYPIIIEYITEESQNEWFKSSLNHLNVEFITDRKNANNKYLSFYFYDQLSFGTLKASSDKSILEKKLRELGPDLLDPKTTIEVFTGQIRKKVNENKPIGNVIVNQKIIAGIGNYLRADALWMAKISPFRKVKDTNDKELEILYWSIISLIWGDYNYKEGMKKGYIKYDLPDKYKRDFFIYKQENDIHGKKITKEELFEGSQKRFIYWVKDIQK